MQSALFPELARVVVPDNAQDAASNEWFTPKWLLRWLPPIAFDPCHSTQSNVVARVWLDVRRGDDGLRDLWLSRGRAGEIVFVNPPYDDCATWVEKCAERAATSRMPIVALVPGYAGDQYWHRAVWARAAWVGFVAGRIRFDTPTGKAKDSASFTSALVCWGAPAAAQRVLEHVHAKRREFHDPRGLFVVRADRPFDGVQS